MMNRYLTITMQSDWQAALRASGQLAKADTYQGEVLNFESPGHFFGQLSEKRWEIVRACQGKGEPCLSGWLPKRGFDAKFAVWIHAAFQRRSLNFRRSSPMTKPARNIWSAFGGHRDFRAPNAVR